MNVPDRRFKTTSWTLIRAATSEGQSPDAEALEEVASRYWFPIYAYVRHLGFDSEEASDITQSYFAKLLERDYLAVADPMRGRLRSFLRASVRNFASDWRRHRNAARRSPVGLLSLDQERAEQRYLVEPVDSETPESVFERAWARQVLSRAAEALGLAEVAAGRGARWDALKETVVGLSDLSYSTLADAQDVSVGAIKVSVHRLRRKLLDRVRAELEDTVGDVDQLETEVLHVQETLRREASE